ncbi:MAG: hypothetical protein LUF33_07205 [Clostridiales bacterium]|nr:hypothetical protein [Clostridiales bacterium]
MKRLVGITGIILIGCLFISTFASSADSSVPDGTAVVQAESEAESRTAYVLKAEGGRIVVYVKGDDAPYLTTDTFVSNLPAGDKKRLEEGIEVMGKAQLRSALEDYCS